MIYEFTVQHIGVDEKGNDKVVKETYITENKELFAEVEALALSKFEGYTDLDVIAIKRSKVKEIANAKKEETDMVWEATIQQTMVIDEVEKVMKYRILLFAETFDKAKAFITEYLQQGYDMELVSLKLTKIIDVM